MTQIPVDPAEAAIASVLGREGGYVDHPADTGGPTNLGISLRFLRNIHRVKAGKVPVYDGDVDRDGDVDADDVRAITREVAIGFYRREFWDANRYGQLPAWLAPKVFDLAVNMGPAMAHKLLQRSLRACGHRTILDDGVLGTISRGAIDTLARSPVGEVKLMAALRSEAAGRYREIVATSPSQRVFLNGWLRRAYDE